MIGAVAVYNQPRLRPAGLEIKFQSQLASEASELEEKLQRELDLPRVAGV